MDEVENEWKRQGDINQAERSDCRRESMERDETMIHKLACDRFVKVDLQVYNAKKGLNPATLFRVFRCSHPGMRNEQSFGVMRRGGGRIWERGFP